MLTSVFEALGSAFSSTAFQVEFALLFIGTVFAIYRLRSIPPVGRLKHTKS